MHTAGGIKLPTTYRSKIIAAIHETGSDLYESGGMDRKSMRNFDALCLTPIPEMTSEKI